MRLIKEPRKEDKSWLALSEDVDPTLLHKRILSADVCISDLDGTDADPAREIALENKIFRFFTSRKYAGWLLGAGWDTLTRNPIKKETVISRRWKKYVDLFLNDEESISALNYRFTTDYIQKSLFPGVEEFYSLLRTQKFYVTRNIYPIAAAYGSILGFSGVLAEEDNKSKRLETFIEKCPYFQRYIIKGDSIGDAEMNDVLRHYLKKKKIKDVVGIYVSKKPKESQMNKDFAMNIGRNYGAVNDFIKYGHLDKNFIST